MADKMKTHPTVVTSGDDPKPPKFGTPEPVETGGKLPRVIQGTERAIPGGPAKRFKIRCDSFPACKTRYILARTKEDAIKLYDELDKITQQVEAAQKSGTKMEPNYAISELPD